MIEFNVSFSMYLSNINNYNHQQCLRTEPNYIWGNLPNGSYSDLIIHLSGAYKYKYGISVVLDKTESICKWVDLK